MSTKTTPAANADLDSKYGLGTAGGWYVGALTAVTDAAAGTVTEAVGGTYARKPVSFAAAAARAKANDAAVTMEEATVDHGNVVAWGIFDALSGGTPDHVIQLATPINYNTGYQPVIRAGELTVGEAAYA